MGDEAIVKAGILRIDALELQFGNTLVLYKQAYLDYKNPLNNRLVAIRYCD